MQFKVKSCSLLTLNLFFLIAGCKKNEASPPANPDSYSLSFLINGKNTGLSYTGISINPVIQFSFTSTVSSSSLKSGISFTNDKGNAVAFNVSAISGNSVFDIVPAVPLNGLSKYSVSVSSALQSESGGKLTDPVSISLSTGIDSSDKFTQISDSALLTLVEQQTFKYFWDNGNATSGMAQERTSSGNTCATGGTGFGIMSMLVAVNRNFISRNDALTRVQKIVSFLKNNCTTYHGAFSHWINGNTGATIPFSNKDDGGDIVETSYLFQGLLCARQYFNQSNALEDTLRSNINALWNGMDWNWYRQSGGNYLTWHWSPNYGFDLNVHISGWDEALITYALAASSNTSAIPKAAYDNGWARNGNMQNGQQFYGITLPLGPDLGGPLFFAHYSFLGINPHSLVDAYANYWTQDTAHATINYKYCVANPKNYYGYSSSCWGLTASDIQNGYDASSPTEDNGVIAPTAAISSLPYTPTESMNALRFFYYKLGDKLWGKYGFYDAFNLTNPWFDSDCLAIDQGPEIVMIENYRSGLLWSLFMSCPEVKRGMTNLGFTSPYF